MEREELEVDVLFIGAGPASLSSAYHLSRLLEEKQIGPITILVLEKGKEIGSHALSGAVVDPRAFQELLAGTDLQPPYDGPVTQESLQFLTRRRHFRSPFVPPPLRNYGYQVASLGELVQWLGGLCEETGVEVYPGFPASELLFEGRRVVGARTADSGLDAEGNPKANFQPGMDVRARVVVLGEGPCGTLAGQARRRLELDRGKQPQIYAVGVKEVWRSSKSLQRGEVIHTLGYPLPRDEFGGGFLYTFHDDLIHLGLVVGLDSPHPDSDSHERFQLWKSHPLIRSYLEEAELVSYGAKAIPEGGYYAIPRLCTEGLLLIGDSAGLVNSQRLKGIHLAVKSGMLAAETIAAALEANDFGSSRLERYEEALKESWAGEELWRVRNFRQSFQGGFWSGVLHASLQHITRGRGWKDPYPIRPGHEVMKRLDISSQENREIDFDEQVTFDKATSVFHSNTSHEEEQPSHLKILKPDVCDRLCTKEYGNPCRYFCPADVYEILSGAVKDRLRINFSNCVHCKTCQIADPYQVILWTPPEGGGGPDWKGM